MQTQLSNKATGKSQHAIFLFFFISILCLEYRTTIKAVLMSETNSEPGDHEELKELRLLYS